HARSRRTADRSGCVRHPPATRRPRAPGRAPRATAADPRKLRTMLSERVAFTPGITSTATSGRLYVITGQSLCVAYDTGSGVPRSPVGPAPRSALSLGDLAGAPCFAQLLGEGEASPQGTDPIALRQLFGALPDDDFAIAGRALGLTAWDRDHRHCGRCGAPTERSQTERVRTCSRCGLGAYPRLSPAIIALIERAGRALLART